MILAILASPRLVLGCAIEPVLCKRGANLQECMLECDKRGASLQNCLLMCDNGAAMLAELLAHV